MKAAVCDALRKFMDPTPKTIIDTDAIFCLFKEKYQSTDANEPAQAECKPVLDAALKQMLVPYEAIVENHRRARQTIEHEWIATDIHQHFYREVQDNYEYLQQVIRQRRWSIS